MLKIERLTIRYSRTCNGAWGFASSECEILHKPEEWLTKDVSINDGLTVVWPDGATESVYPSRIGPGYPPQCFPADGRLAKIFSRGA